MPFVHSNARPVGFQLDLDHDIVHVAFVVHGPGQGFAGLTVSCSKLIEFLPGVSELLTRKGRVSCSISSVVTSPQCWPLRHVVGCLVQSSAEAEHKSGDDALAVALKLGEATVQLQLTVGQIKAMTLERMVQIWKVSSQNDVTHSVPCLSPAEDRGSLGTVFCV